jgi:hypothetical protein
LKCNAGVLSPNTFRCVALRSKACLLDISSTDSNRRAKMFDFQRHERSEIASAFTCMELCKSYPYFLLTNNGTCECLWNPRAAEVLPSSQGCGTYCYDDEEAGSNFPCGTATGSSLYESPAFELEDTVTRTELSTTSQYKSFVSVRANYVLAYSSDLGSVTDDELRSDVMSPVLSSMIETVMNENNVDQSYVMCVRRTANISFFFASITLITFIIQNFTHITHSQQYHLNVFNTKYLNSRSRTQILNYIRDIEQNAA